MSKAENPETILVDQRLESTLDSVDATEERVKSLCTELGFPEDEAYQLGYAVREAMVNAVVHGNGYSANKFVHFKLSRNSTSLCIQIEDEGQGFAPDQQADPLAEENLLNQSGRGIMIIRAFVDDFAIEHISTGGTRVSLRKTLPPETL